MNKKIKLISFFALSFFLFSCENNEEIKKTANKRVKVVNNVILKEQKDLTTISNFFGGVQSSQIDSLIPNNLKDQWTKYTNKMDATYKNVNSKKEIMSVWENKNISIKQGTLFYPFSGPDFLHANVFFPNYDTIIMIGLEPTGLADVKLSQYTEPKVFSDITRSLGAILNHSFFLTKEMAVDFTNTKLNGTLPVFMHFFSRTGYSIYSVEDVFLKSNGEIVNVKNNKSVEGLYKGLCYQVIKDNKLKRIYYFSMNLANDRYSNNKGLKDHPEIGLMMDLLNIKTTYLKAASYLLHNDSFSILRNLILKYTDQLVQDDSGLPIKYLINNKSWNTTFYGYYTNPISLFDVRYQQDLYNCYHNPSVPAGELPFGIGYKSIAGTSNMSISIKNK
jgi:hypothetical protein